MAPCPRTITGRCFKNALAEEGEVVRQRSQRVGGHSDRSSLQFVSVEKQTGEKGDVSVAATILEPHRGRLEHRLASLLQQLLGVIDSSPSAGREDDFCIYTGSAGVCLSLVKLSRLLPGAQDRSRCLTNAAIVFPENQRREAVVAATCSSPVRSRGYSSLLASTCGIFYVQALLDRRQREANEATGDRTQKGGGGGGGKEDISTAATPVGLIDYLSAHPDAMLGSTSDEWLYGRAGYLHGLLLLRRVFFPSSSSTFTSEPNTSPSGPSAASPSSSMLSVQLAFDTQMDEIASKMVTSGRHLAKTVGCVKACPLMYEWHQEKYIGAAHGLFGILYFLLHVPSVLQDAHNRTVIVDTLRYLVGLQTSHGNWPAVLGDRSDHLVHFCHGAPGAVFLFLQAAKALPDGEEWRRVAVKAATTVWTYGLLRKGGSLCHGMSGNGYALLAMFRETLDPVWFDRAVYFALNLVDEELPKQCSRPDSPTSLFEGNAGWLCFLADLLYAPTRAAFPVFELGGFD